MRKMEASTEKMVKGALSLTISTLIVKFLGLVYKVPLSYILSDVGMGYFNSAYTVYTFFYLICTAGVPKAISILVSDAESQGDFVRVRSVYKTAFSAFFVFGAAVSIFFLLSASKISELIANKEAAMTMAVIAPSIMFVCASGVIRGYFSGKMNFMPIAVSEVISGVFKLGLGLLFAIIAVRVGAGLHVVSALTILGITLGSFGGFLYLWICKKIENKALVSEQKYKNNRFSKKILFDVLKISIPLTLTSAVGNLSGIIDLGIIMKRLASAGYTEFQASVMYGNYTTLAIPMLNLVATLIAPLSAVLLPVISRSDTKNDRCELSVRVSDTVKVVSFISIPCAFVFSFKADMLLGLIFDDTSAILAAPLLQILAPGVVFMCFLTVINTTLEGVGKTKAPLISLAVGAGVKFALSYLLIGNEEYGIIGAPIGTVVFYVTSFLISVSYLTLSKRVLVNFVSAILFPSVASVISLVISDAILPDYSAHTAQNAFISLLVFGITYFLLMLLLRFVSQKRVIKLAKYTKK